MELVKKLTAEPNKYDVAVEKTFEETTLIDAGCIAKGGFLAGEVVMEICLGGHAVARILPKQYENLFLPSVFVYTDNPALSTLASQLAGWQISVDDYSAVGCGPARILAGEPRDLFKKLDYNEDSQIAVLVLETDSKPSKPAIEKIASQCHVAPADLYIVYSSPMSLTTSILSAGRSIEAGMWKLMIQGLDPWAVSHAWGYAPIIPLYPNRKQIYEKNNAISCGGTANYMLTCDDDEKLRKMTTASTASASRVLQEAIRLAANNPSYMEVIREGELDIDNSDSRTAPAVIVVNNQKTGKTFQTGNIDIDGLKMLLGAP
jgi:methenyltetrahydromethanopterin cyclohydrolase